MTESDKMTTVKNAQDEDYWSTGAGGIPVPADGSVTPWFAYGHSRD
jgi:hypothetical protein